MSQPNIARETRRESFQMILANMDKRLEAVRGALGDQELAGFEIAAILGLETYLVLPRLTKLKELRRVEVCGKRWNPKTSRNVAVYRRILP